MMVATEKLTPEQQEAARKAQKAEKERRRREQIKQAKVALERAGLDPETKLTAEQRERAAKAPAGLANKALETFIMDGKHVGEQVEESRATRAAAAREERARQNVTKSADPEASELARAAKALAPDIRSSFLPREARAVLDFVGERDALEVADLKKGKLEAFGIRGEKDPEVRARLIEIKKEVPALWGRKAALFFLALAAQQKKQQK
jgi:hypothetical protein